MTAQQRFREIEPFLDGHYLPPSITGKGLFARSTGQSGLDLNLIQSGWTQRYISLSRFLSMNCPLMQTEENFWEHNTCAIGPQSEMSGHPAMSEYIEQGYTYSPFSLLLSAIQNGSILLTCCFVVKFNLRNSNHIPAIKFANAARCRAEYFVSGLTPSSTL